MPFLCFPLDKVDLNRTIISSRFVINIYISFFSGYKNQDFIQFQYRKVHDGESNLYVSLAERTTYH